MMKTALSVENLSKVYLSGKKSLRVNFSNGESFEALPRKFTIKSIN